MNSKRARVIAFYLPQFHPIPENDKFWGKGFTEWTNVTQAKPLFKGHYQPKLPADLGFYDLRLPEIREAQAEMARESGIEGFMYWNYWFGNGRKLLEKPLLDVLKSKKPDFPFCVGWANHSWSTKTWVKGEFLQRDTMIMEQLYLGESDYTDYFNFLLPAFKDKRYITVDGKPIFVIYDPMKIPDVNDFIKLWKELALKNGLKGIHFVGLRYRRQLSYENLIEMGFDAMNNRGMGEAEAAVVGNKWLKIIKSQIALRLNGTTLMKYNYKDIIKFLNSEKDLLENVYPTILSGYDRSPRAGKRAVIYHGFTPELFGKHIDMVMELVENKDPEHKVVFLKSWNEWGEGNYVEPDLKYGWGFLNELKKRLK